MGWTGGYTRADGATREVITKAYEGDPLGCASCSWREASHPRVSGSEYDAIYGADTKRERPAPHDFTPYVPSSRVLGYAARLNVAWLAVETIATGEVWAGVCLIHRGGGEYAIKELTETMGPGETNAPARILDLLTPTSDATALEWRAACRARLDRMAASPKVTAGIRIRFARPLSFTNGVTRDTFEYVKGSTFRAIEPEGWPSSTRYTVSNWRELAYAAVPA